MEQGKYTQAFPEQKKSSNPGVELCNALKIQVVLGWLHKSQMQEEFLIQNSITAAIKTTMLDLGTRLMLHNTDPRFLDAKMSDITITCKLSVISSLVHIENTVKISNLQSIKIQTPSTWIVSLKVFYQFYLFSAMLVSIIHETNLCFISSVYTLTQKFCNRNILILIYSRNLLPLSI